ncbi:MAG: hypothetical protein ACRD68_01030, partial [Pyrinomonadaceae bacterium]
MRRLTWNRLGRVAGYLWLCFLAITLWVSAQNAYRLSLATEEYPYACDSFGYLEMAKEIRQAAARLEVPTFDLKSRQTDLLVNLMRERNLPPPRWNNLVGPHAYHYFPKAGHVGVQYPPGTGLTLALFPERKAVRGLNRAVVSLLFAAGIVALLVAALRRAWASAGLVVLAVHVGLGILIRLGPLSFSINVVLVPLLAACLLSLAALWLKAGTPGWPRLAWLSAFGAGLCLGYATLVRLPSILFVPGFLLLLWPRGGAWRKAFGGLPGALCLAVIVGGLIPLFVHQQLTAGAWYVSTYSPSVRPNLPTPEILRFNTSYYFGTGYPTEDNWSLLCLLAGFLGGLLFAYARRRPFYSARLGLGWGRLTLSALALWAIPTGFFLTQKLTGLHYAMSQTFAALALVGFGALAIENTSGRGEEGRESNSRLAVSALALCLALVPGVAAFRRAWSARAASPAPAQEARQPLILPAELSDERAWVWADLLTGTLWYYANKPAFR